MIISADNILKNFIGNKNTAINLINSLHKSSYNGAWILRGLKGIGKAKLAENIIIELYKIKNRKGDLIHPDLFTLDNKKTDKKFISVEEVRKVPSFLSKTSINSSYKTILIDSLNSLNNFGHNALLKTLENQNSNTIFFLIDHMNSYIPNTIKSRCKTVLFKRLSNDDLIKLLAKSNISEGHYKAYATLSNGSIGEVYSMHKNHALEIHKNLCNFILEKNDKKKNTSMVIQSLFKNKKNNSKIFSICFLIIFRILKNTLSQINSIKVSNLNNLEEKLIINLSQKLRHDDIIKILKNLYNRKKNMLNFNLDPYSTLYLTLSELEIIIEKNEK